MAVEKMHYGNVKDVVVIQFGHGTTSIVNANGVDGHKALLMKTTAPKEIGEMGEKDDSSDEYKPEVAIVFHNKESFDVFKEFVDHVAKEYNDEIVTE